jgi:hypothetical protein
MREKRADNNIKQLPEAFSFSATMLQPSATGNVRKNIDVIYEYDTVLSGKVRKTRF